MAIWYHPVMLTWGLTLADEKVNDSNRSEVIRVKQQLSRDDAARRIGAMQGIQPPNLSALDIRDYSMAFMDALESTRETL